jgi:hypothetical protein
MWWCNVCNTVSPATATGASALALAFAFVFLVVIPEGNLLFLSATAISSNDTFRSTSRRRPESLGDVSL